MRHRSHVQDNLCPLQCHWVTNSCGQFSVQQFNFGIRNLHFASMHYCQDTHPRHQPAQHVVSKD